MFTNPLKNLKALRIREDSIVADLGAGTGHYTILAGKIAHKGRVYAVDIVKDFLAHIKTQLHGIHLPNIEILWGNVEKKNGTGIGDGVIDVVIASNILFQLEYKDNFADEVNRILKSKGRVLLIDWNDESPVLSGKKVFPKHRAQEIFERKGFTVDREIDAGAHHYGMILVKS